jgi:hypothetical protein
MGKKYEQVRQKQIEETARKAVAYIMDYCRHWHSSTGQQQQDYFAWMGYVHDVAFLLMRTDNYEEQIKEVVSGWSGEKRPGS